MRDERLDQGRGKHMQKRTLLWGKVDLFTAAVSWEIGGEESGKKRASGKISPMYKANKQSKERKMEREGEHQSLQVDFQKELH